MKNILKAKRINKVYEIGKGNTQQILRDVDISIGDGEFVSVMSPSASGKSTLLYNISGMDKVISGSIQFYDEELTAMSEEKLSALRLGKKGFIDEMSENRGHAHMARTLVRMIERMRKNRV